MMLSVQTHLIKWRASIIASVLHVHVFLLENSKGLSFSGGCLVSMWRSSFEGFMASLDSQYHILYKVGLENVNHLLQ